MPDQVKQTVLVVDDHENVRKQLYWALEDNYRVIEADSRARALAIVEQEPLDVVLCDLRMPPNQQDITEGLAILEAVRKFNPLLPVIVITGDEDRETALKVVQRGAYDLFYKPFNVAEVEIIVRRAAQHYLLEKDNLNLRSELRRSGDWQEGIVGSSPVLRRVMDQARAVAETSATVLITGESGTGKEMMARFIHNISPRARAPFVACNIAALPETLVESELFGHEKGAFTGAATRRQGRFELADTGTLFLDEIGEMTPAMQVKLLRVLQEREFERLGGQQKITVDIRVVSATNRSLEQMIEAGQFREDLYYRLNSRRCANAPKTSRFWPTTSPPKPQPNTASRSQRPHKASWIIWSRTAGRATSANLRMLLSALSSSIHPPYWTTAFCLPKSWRRKTPSRTLRNRPSCRKWNWSTEYCRLNYRLKPRSSSSNASWSPRPCANATPRAQRPRTA
jgi:DNA-binding NtrC family response regulator